MSFASDIKDSLCRTESEKSCCRTAELAAIICFAGSVRGQTLKIKTENESVAKHVETLLSDIINKSDFAYEMPKSQSGIHTISVKGERTYTAVCEKLMLGVNENVLLCPNCSIYKSSCCKTAFLRGAFLGGGSMSDPSKNYHAEFVTKNAPLADMLYELLLAEKLGAKITVRKNSFVTYIKDSEMIARLLGMMGAGMSMMEFYNIKIERELRNTVNRQVNCDNANLDKITLAAQNQIAAIRKIENTIGFGALPPAIYEIAQLRVQNPEMSLKELGTMLSPPIGKSGVNHRLERLCEIAQEIH